MRTVRKWLDERCVVRKGSNRLVIDFLRLGFVIKIPVVHGILFIRSLIAFLHKRSTIPFWRWVAYPMDSEGYLGCKRLLFKGVADNWREFLFFCFRGHPFSQPTYFSLFGLANIQKRGNTPRMEYWEFRRQLQRLIGEERFYSDCHHFAEVKNFCIHQGRLQIVDYGSPKTQKVISEVGVCVFNNFRLGGAE